MRCNDDPFASPVEGLMQVSSDTWLEIVREHFIVVRFKGCKCCSAKSVSCNSILVLKG